MDKKIIVDLKEYEELESFKQNILDGSICTIDYGMEKTGWSDIESSYRSFSSTVFFTKDEIIKGLTKKLNSQIKLYDDLKEKYENLLNRQKDESSKKPVSTSEEPKKIKHICKLFGYTLIKSNE